MKLKLSVVDQSPVYGSHPAIEAPKLSIELAKACDDWGYYRYWVAEHHDSIHFAIPCPEIVMTAIASVTDNIRVGSGGVMLSHYSPLKVAENFKMLETLFPGRIDLGIGRAPGGTGLTSEALAFPYEAHHGDMYSHQAQQLKGFIEGSLSRENPYQRINVLPDSSPQPELWMLGSSGGSAGLAGHLGYNMALARFIDPDNCRPAIFTEYMEQWQLANHQADPHKMLAIACICAQTEEEAKLRAGTAVYRKLATQMGIEEAFLTPCEVQDRYLQLSPSLQAAYDDVLNGYTVGTPEQCAEEINQLAIEYRCDEISIVTVTHSFADRLDSYRLLAKGL